MTLQLPVPPDPAFSSLELDSLTREMAGGLEDGEAVAQVCAPKRSTSSAFWGGGVRPFLASGSSESAEKSQHLCVHRPF